MRVPRTTGEILSDGIGLLRTKFKTLYLLALPFCAVDLLMREGGSTVMSRARVMLTENVGAFGGDALLRGLAALFGAIGLLVGSFVLLTALSAGVIQIASDAWRGREPAIANGLRAIVDRAGWLALTTLLSAFAFVLWMIPGIVVLALALVFVGVVGQVLSVVALLAWGALGAIVMTLRWGLFGQAVVLEERAGLGALGRSRDLLAGRGLPLFESAKWRLSLLFIVSLAVTSTLQSVFAAPRIVYAVATDWVITQGLPPLASMPLYFAGPLAVVEVALNAIVVTLGPVLLTLFYYDLRVRYEGLDLEDAP